MKRLSIVLLLICSVFFLGGCGSSSTSSAPTQNIQEAAKPKIPEPYTLMLEQVKSNDLEMAEKYADLTIKDFPDSPYIYNVYLIKNSITLSKISMENIIYSFLKSGIEQGVSLANNEEKDRLKIFIDKYLEENNKYQSSLNETTKHLLTNYSENEMNKEYKLPPSMTPEGMIDLQTNDLSTLDWFSKVSYPVPTESDIVNARKLYPKIFYFAFFDENGNVNYPMYFYDTYTVIFDKTLQIELLNKVIQITENDQYNEYRIKAQEALNEQP